MRQKHCMTWNMVRITEKLEKCDTHTVGPGVWRETEKHGKYETHTVGLGICREN
jgi:hypothetical protein